jgi:formylglycine-generating enzyme required for sulfatase activity
MVTKSLTAVLCICIVSSAVFADMTYFAYQGEIDTVVQIGKGNKAGEGAVSEITSMGDKQFGSGWSIEFSGVMNLSKAGNYEFVISSDDGSALYINNKEVINNDGPHAVESRTKSIKLKAGNHQINLLYFNRSGDHALSATVRLSEGPVQDLATVCTPGKKRVDSIAASIAAASKRAAEELEISSPDALIRSIQYILKNQPRAYKNGQTFLKQAEAFKEKLPELLKNREAGDSEVTKAIKEYDTLKYTALVKENPYLDFDEVLVILSNSVDKKPNWLGTQVIGPRGHQNKIARLNLKTGQITDIYKPEDGSLVCELDLHYDGQKLLFSQPDKKGQYQVMEVGIEGNNLRQVSTIEGDDVHNYGGIYLPSEKIIFSSTAPMIGVPCIGGKQLVPNLYGMDSDGRNTRQLTFEQDADWYPTVTADGKVMYLRWEYTDIMHYYSRIMMTMNPDGTNQRSLYGSQSLWPNAMFYARPLPGEPGKFSAVISGHHGVAGAGKLTIFDTNKGYAHADGVVQYIPGYGKEVTHVTVDQLYPTVKKELLVKFPDLQKIVTKLINEYMPGSTSSGKDYHDLNNDFFNKCYPRLREYYPDEMALDLDELVDGVYPQFYKPYPVSAQYYLTVAQLAPGSDWGLYLVDTFDNFVPIRFDNAGYKYMVEPYPLKKRQRPPVIPDRVNIRNKEATCYIQNIYRGPGLKGVPKGTVDRLRVFTYAYGYYQLGSHNHIGVESGWDMKRLLGTVKVETDGSAMFKIPANTTISLQPLDKQGRAIQLFRSWIVAMPGEDLSCIGCHESPSEPPVTQRTIASNKKPQLITPYREKVEGFSFNAEIQPVLDAYCTRCHDGTDAAKPDFKDTTVAKPSSFERNFSNAYYALHKYFRRPGPESSGLMCIPYEFHASASEGVQLLSKGHYGVDLDPESWQRLYAWIDLNVPYHGSWTNTYAADEKQKQYTEDISARAADFRAKYAQVESDWEYTPVRPYPVSVSKTKGPQKSDPVKVSAQNWPLDASQAEQLQQAAGPALKKEIDLGNELTITMVRIPAGEFVMGSDEDTPQEQPRHIVKIEKAFWISQSEITNQLFFAFNPHHDAGVFDQQWKDHVRLGYYANYDKQPAVRMSWNQANEFCKWIAQKTGLGAALPTEAQWEWTCRAGSEKAMSFGSKESDFSPYANLADKSIERFAVTGINPTFRSSLVNDPIYDFVPRISKYNDNQFLISGTQQYKPNAWGVYDMHGNVAEWTRSDYVSYPYRADVSNSLDDTTDKVVRGGSFYDRPYRATSSYRLGYAPWQGVFNVGFRIVIED